MLPGFRFLFAAILLSMSILIFGLGAAALLRAAHEEFASNPTWRAPPETVFAHESEPAKPVLATLVVEPAPAQQAAKPVADEFAARGQREARSIKYGDWQKLCFKPGGAKMACRTTISGAFETGQTAVRVYLTEREGGGTARLQLFLPVGLYMPPGVKHHYCCFGGKFTYKQSLARCIFQAVLVFSPLF